ncbi:MAG: redoxin domain-containing protein [Nitrospirae bacterium]|nr:redoxin domain-containing protein [Nitrospirota bacterium]
MKKKSLILATLLLAGLSLIVYFISQRDTGKKEPIAAIGLPAPNLEVADAATGRTLSSSDFKGRVLFINFWATWCQPCREEMPSIEGLFKHFMDNKDFVMLTILFRDDPQTGINYLKQNRFNFPLMLDMGGQAARVYGLTGVPETYIVDKKGILREKIIGPYQWDSPDALELISRLLKE